MLYLAEHLAGAFVETFGDVWEVGADANLVPAAALASHCVSVCRLSRSLVVCDLTGEGLARIGADGRLTAGERRVAQQWALAIWMHPAGVDGIRYRVRHDQDEIAVALFDRAADALTVEPPGTLGAHPELPDLLERYRVALV